MYFSLQAKPKQQQQQQQQQRTTSTQSPSLTYVLQLLLFSLLYLVFLGLLLLSSRWPYFNNCI